MDDLVKRARDLLDGTTPGPWLMIVDDCGRNAGRPGVFSSDEIDCGIVHWDGFAQDYWRSARGDKEMHANARFIAATRELVPQMADRIGRLEAAMREATEIVHKSYVSATLDAVNAGPSHPLQGNYDKWRVRCMNAEAACRAALEGK